MHVLPLIQVTSQCRGFKALAADTAPPCHGCVILCMDLKGMTLSLFSECN